MNPGLAIALVIAAALLLGLSVGRPYLTNLISGRIDSTPQPRSTGFSTDVATNPTQIQQATTPIQPTNRGTGTTDETTAPPPNDRPINGKW
jgi:hypothetical protein